MANAVKQAFEEHVVLLSVSEFVLVLNLEALHQVAELVLSQPVFRPDGIALHDTLQALTEAFLGLGVIFRFDWPLQQINNKVGSLVNRDVVVRLEVEQERAEDVAVGDAIVQQRVDVRVLEGTSLQLLLLCLAGEFFRR